VFDDLILEPIYLTRPPGGLAATPLGLEFHRSGQVRKSQLDEDKAIIVDRPFPLPNASVPQRDELYGGIRLLNATGTSVTIFETNRVNGYF
jgi:hypothetical protein